MAKHGLSYKYRADVTGSATKHVHSESWNGGTDGPCGLTIILIQCLHRPMPTPQESRERPRTARHSAERAARPASANLGHSNAATAATSTGCPTLAKRS